MSDVFPGLRYQDADAALTWLTEVLGLRELEVIRDTGGRIVHAELGWGDGAVMFGQASTGEDGRLPLPAGGGECYLVAAEPALREAYQRVVDAGVTVLDPLSDKGYGLGFTVTDPEGNAWSLGNYRPAAPAGSPGWLEIGVPGTGPTQQFFAGLFGWRAEPMPGDNANFTGPGLRAGVHGGDDATNIVVYFAVPDIDAAVARVRELGGTIDDAGPDQQGVGRFTAGKDPQGVDFGLFQAPSTVS